MTRPRPPPPRPRPFHAFLLLILVLLFLLGSQSVDAAGFRGPNGYPGQNTGQVTLGLLSEKAVREGAVCLDGSPPAYYYRPGFGSGKAKFLIYYEGGGWCNSDVDCVFRGCTTLGSSKHYWLRNDVSTGLGSYFLNQTSNPLYNWNILFLKYCDGSSYSSWVPDPVPNAGVFQNKTLYYRGQRIHQAFMEEFVVNHGLLEATDVVLAGCSAGGLAVYLHIDEVAAMFEKAGRGNRTKVRGLADSGFFLDADGPGCHAAADLRWLAHRAKSPATPDPSHLSCLVAAAERRRARQRKEARDGGVVGVEQEEEGGFAAEDRAHCLFARNVIPSLRTPVFSFVSRYDGAQLTSFACLTPENSAALPDPKTITAAGNQFRDALIESFQATAVPHGYLLDACHRHCFWAMAPLGGSDPWTQAVINPWTNVKAPSGRTAAGVFWDWYEGKGGIEDWREEVVADFPCAACCGVPVAE